MIVKTKEQVKADVQEDRERVMIMDQLYIEDGRHLKTHKMHGLYSGLWIDYIKKQKSEILSRALKD